MATFRLHCFACADCRIFMFVLFIKPELGYVDDSPSCFTRKFYTFLHENMGVRRVKPSNRFRLHPTSMISKHSTVPVPDSLYRRLEKLVLASIFDTSLSTLMMWNLQSYTTAVLNKIMWHFGGSKHTLIPPTYFQGVKIPNPRIYAPDTNAWPDETVEFGYRSFLVTHVM